ncbi:PREDICTED: microtubule-associated tumor suppressor candidate 2-like, partial [Gekko japonicus]|uniref:Microtubule-associated tumor suppressor candidate 2-like n=1 Tax=Gekko japonicus TaxID=146911 RepID=A0ABM1L3D6_GEKJA
MNTPLVPNKSCYNLIQDNRNEMKNNNENTVTIGDTNANQITSEVRTPGRKVGTNDLAGETRLNIGKPENNTQLDSERNRLQDTTGVSEVRLPTTTNRELHKDYRADGAKDMSKIVPISRGHSLSNLRINTNDTFSVVLSKSDADLIQHVSKDRMPRRIEPEGIKRLSLGRSRKLTAKTEAFGREFVGRVSGKRLLSASLDSIDTSHHLTGDTETSQKASVDHFLGMASDGNIMRYSKSTSETKKINVSATQMSVDSAPNFIKQSTSHPSHADQHLTVKSNDIWSRSEAQLDHKADRRGKWELKSPLSSQPRSLCQQKMDRVIMAEFLRCQREENNVVQYKKDYEAEVHKVKSLHSQDDDPYSKEVVDSMNDRSLRGNNYSSLGRGSSHSESEAVNQVREKYVVEKEADAAFCLTDENKPSSKLTPTRNENMHDTDSSCSQAVGGHMSFVHSINPPDGKHLNDNESKLMLIKENSEHFAGPASDLPEQPEMLDTESELDEHSNIQDNGLETASFSVQGKKTLMKKHISNDLLESCNVSSRTDTFVCAPTPLRPVATVNSNTHPTLSNGNLKNLYALHVDKLSPTAVLPPFDGTQLLSLSAKVPNKTACNSSIPKPILVNSNDPHPSKSDGIHSNCIEKPEENVETKPDVPKPKHVRPKIITYIRRNPQAISQLDHSFTTSGLPYGPPGCGVPVTKESNNSNDGEIKPANMLYDKFKPDLQKPRIYSSGLMVSGIKSSGHHFSQMGEKFLQEVGERPVKEEFCPPPYAHYEVPPSFYRSAMILKPQLGLGAVSRLPSAKSRILIASQRSSASCIHQQGPITSSPTLFHPDATADLKKSPTPNTIKSNLPKPCPSGLRPPGYSRLPAAKLAAFGFVRSSSVSSISSNQSNDSVQSDQSRTANLIKFVYTINDYALEQLNMKPTGVEVNLDL